MPVRFRCVYCNQLLGIARRKAGTVVHCTSCNGQLIVPDPDEGAKVGATESAKSGAFAEAKGAGSKLFEQSDIDELLRPFQDLTDKKLVVAAPAASDGRSAPTPSPGSLVRKGVIVDRMETIAANRAWLVVLAAIILAVVFFGVGFIAGRYSV